MAKLALTGERTAPGWDRERYWFMRHLAVYQWIADTVLKPGDDVADVGCGEGFGANLLAEQAGRTVAIELDEPTCRHAHREYPAVHCICANVVALPLANQSVDLAVSLQVMEHIWDVPGYLAQLRRICRGTLVLSTPNRPVFSPGLGRSQTPVNPFHVEEFDADQVAAACRGVGFRNVHILGLHHGARVREWEDHNGSMVAALVDAATRDDWTGPVMAAQATLDVADFSLTESHVGAHDLIAIAT